MIPEPGTKWWSTEGKKFHVIHRIELEGKIWIHYIREDKENSQEYSCYEESFLSRFTPLPE
jgi:hypothetical protein